MEFTKGEWKARYAGHDLPWYIDTETREVAKILVYPVYPDNEARANAHLIASAPLLYEACKSALSAFELARTDRDVLYPMKIRIEQALARADGKEV